MFEVLFYIKGYPKSENNFISLYFLTSFKTILIANAWFFFFFNLSKHWSICGFLTIGNTLKKIFTFWEVFLATFHEMNGLEKI